MKRSPILTKLLPLLPVTMAVTKNVTFLSHPTSPVIPLNNLTTATTTLTLAFAAAFASSSAFFFAASAAAASSAANATVGASATAPATLRKSARPVL